MPDWYKTHSASPDAYPDEEYYTWAQDNGLYVDAAGNVDYGPPEPPAASEIIHATESPCPRCNCLPSDPWGCGCAEPGCPCSDREDDDDE